jgi:predicted O-methyltransferase YrrM
MRLPGDIRERLALPARRAFLGSRFLRAAAGLVSGLRSPQRRLDLAHLRFFHEETALGPIQREEALLLFALVRVLRPRVVVEFGFHRGHSALNFLLALPPGGRLYSYDVSDGAAAIARRLFASFPAFRYLHKSQAEFAAADVEGAEIDLVLFDAAHDLALNLETFARIYPRLAPGAIIAVHDTGTWARAHMRPEHHSWAAERPGGWLSEEEYQPWEEERRFVNTLRENCPELAQLHLHSARTLRHGLTLLQAAGALRTRAQEGPAGR